jgi:hypothetical protein
LKIEKLNAAIEELATDETITDARTLYILNADYQTYLTNRVKALLCANGEPQFCTEIEDVAADLAVDLEVELAVDATEGNARFLFNKHNDTSIPKPTVATGVHKLFDHLTIKIAFVVCKLRIWCPDHDKAFNTVTMADMKMDGEMEDMMADMDMIADMDLMQDMADMKIEDVMADMADI